MEIFHVSTSTSQSYSNEPQGSRQFIPLNAPKQVPSSILGKRRRQGSSHHYHTTRSEEHSSIEINAIEGGVDTVHADEDQETTRDELTYEHLLDHIREDQRLLSQIAAENSSSSHSTTSTSIDSGNSVHNHLNYSSNFAEPGGIDNSEFLFLPSELSDVVAVPTTQDRHVRLAAAAANFVPFRRHIVHEFRLDIGICSHESQAEESSGHNHASEKKDNQFYGGEPESKVLGDVSGVKDQVLIGGDSGPSQSEISPKVSYSELIRTLHSDSIVPDSCPGSVPHGYEELQAKDTTYGSLGCEFAGYPVALDQQDELRFPKPDCRDQESITATHALDTSPLEEPEESTCHDIDLSQSFCFWTPPPKASSLQPGNDHIAPPSSPPLTCHQDHPQPSSPSKLALPQTPIHTYVSLSQQSSFTSPDRIPTRIPVFGATLSLAQLLGKGGSHAVYYPPDSSSTDSGSDGSEKHNLNFSSGGSLSSLTESSCSSQKKIKIVTRTLKKQMHVAFRRKDYYTPRARCIRFRPNDSDRCVNGTQQEWPPDKMERGYWRVDVSTWPTHEKMKFWDNITQAIRAGRIGWIGAVVEDESEIGNGDVVRVYCFGEAVVHIWVFLFAMSDRRTVKDVQWIDGVGRTVIEVGEERPTHIEETGV
ncbi:uncharacterized protein V1513DRAFT_451074 [Lipomyces chichibuensis]|uniref:uncharacterized protein n=1 Tax=Lipomyces chichibuensis TaxID=1546026 RepID=UPI00334329D8